MILALLDGALATLAGDLALARPFDLVRFALFLVGTYALLAFALATIELPFVMLLRSSAQRDSGVVRAARGWAAALAVAGALLPLEPIATLCKEGFARTSFAGVGIALVGVGLALGALLLFTVLARLLTAALSRAARSKSAILQTLASPTPATLAPLVVIAVWAALVGADLVAPGAREAVSLAGTAVAMLAIQGGLAWLLSSEERARRLAGVGLAGALIAVLGVGSLADAAWRAPRGDPAVTAVSHQTLLGAYVVPALRRGLRGTDPGPIFLPPGIGRHAARRPGGTPPPRSSAATRVPARTRPAPQALPSGALASAGKPPVGAAPGASAPGRAVSPGAKAPPPRRNLLLITFDRFQNRVMALPEASGLQELAARSYQVRLRLPGRPSGALRHLLSEITPPLGSWLRSHGYRTLGFEAQSARGRHQPQGFDAVEVVRGSARRNAADTTIRRAIAVARSDRNRRWLVWVHLPGPWSRSQVARRAAAKRAGLRVSWLVRGLERSRVDEATAVVLVGLPGRPGTKATAMLASPGGAGSRGDNDSTTAFLQRVRRALARSR